MIDLNQHQFDRDRLRERIGLLEEDRGGLMAAIRHMRQGQLDDHFLNDVLRAELARSPDYGVLLESIEAALRCLRRRIDQ
ncbi:MAG TPA: hypothetical protein VN522_08670 [Solirubrobacterales bacterium]|nr:hypothetical protein [Solirubrobacterales bacterium]